MKRCMVLYLFVAILITESWGSMAFAQSNWGIEDEVLNQFFQKETKQLAAHSLSHVKILEDWTNSREVALEQLHEMLGLEPWPERTPLHPTITKTIMRDGVIVENLHFQSMPGLYVTGNLYRPEQQSEPLPAILYVCGHGKVSIDGVSYGNKTHYQHHGAWFAKNGYVCLTIDTIQLGEIEGLHHGTYREGMWWWHNRGYTPAGVEAWNGVRALDYLQSRPEVDGERIGMTGRSGGGAYTWWTAALDERVKVAVPVAGITSLHNHIVDGCIEGHCDCMFMVNTYQWDFAEVAALIAPRPLLISNTDKDRIFPLDGVVDVYAKTRRIYELYGALDHIGLNIAEGPHKDTQELRINAFHWFNRFLKNDDPLIETVATPLFSPHELKVFDQLPSDERVTTIHESFVPESKRSFRDVPEQPDEMISRVRQELRRTSFRNWPQVPTQSSPVIEVVSDETQNDVHVQQLKLHSDDVYALPIVLVRHSGERKVEEIELIICDDAKWTEVETAVQRGFDTEDQTTRLRAYLAPRGLGPTAWQGDEKKQVQIKRRFALLGHTVDSLRIFDCVQALSALMTLPDCQNAKIQISGTDKTSGLAIYTALMTSQPVERLLLRGGVDSGSAPELLEAARIASFPLVALLAAGRCSSVEVWPSSPSGRESWSELEDAVRNLKWGNDRLTVHDLQQGE